MDFATSWKHMGTQGRIDAIRATWKDGSSASQIAAHFHGVSRNAIIGIYNRYGTTHLVDKPLRSPIRTHAAKKPKRRVLKIKPSPMRPLPKPDPLFVANEFHLCGKPMMMLQAKECRFAVNDAEGDELHLFCGMPAERSYCAHHHARVYRVSL